MTMGYIEVAPRLLFVGGAHGANYNFENDQMVVGGGSSVQVGVPIRVGAFWMTPGVGTSWLYVRRTIKHSDVPLVGQTEEQGVHIPTAGLFLRSEYSPHFLSRFNIAVELGSDLLLRSIHGENWAQGFSFKAVGGLGYAFSL
jgi:hypothetical protein